MGPISNQWRYIVVFLIAILLLAVHEIVVQGWAVPGTQDWKDLVLDFSKECFIAGLSALLIAFLLEAPSREETTEIVRKEIEKNTKSLRELAESIAKDAKLIEDTAFRRAFRRDLPKPIFTAIEERFLSSSFFRRGHQGNWNLRVVNVKGESRVEAEVDTVFELINITDTEQTYTPKINVDDRSIAAGQTASITRIQINGVDGDIAKFTKEQDGWYEYLPQVIQPGGTVRVRNVFKFLRYMNDHEVFVTMYPSDSMNLRINYPEGGSPDPAKDEFFNVDIMGGPKHEKSEEAGWVTVRIPSTVLPHQGILMHWRFNRPSVPQTPSPAGASTSLTKVPADPVQQPA